MGTNTSKWWKVKTTTSHDIIKQQFTSTHLSKNTPDSQKNGVLSASRRVAAQRLWSSPPPSAAGPSRRCRFEKRARLGWRGVFMAFHRSSLSEKRTCFWKWGWSSSAEDSRKWLGPLPWNGFWCAFEIVGTKGTPLTKMPSKATWWSLEWISPVPISNLLETKPQWRVLSGASTYSTLFTTSRPAKALSFA